MFRKLCTLLLIATIIHNAASSVVDRAKRCYGCPEKYDAKKACPDECKANGCTHTCSFTGDMGDCSHLWCYVWK
ncbi:hypothetical protein COOONC_19103 [Cooperia oncophora]